MARLIQSPGIQITEIDLSLNEQTPTGTIVCVPGFATQGPVDEPLAITSVSELEQIYGSPTTPAEKYFHYSCREILKSPGRLTTLRLGYGEGLGSAYTNGYSALVYPMLSSLVGTPSTEFDWEIGAPIHVPLSRTEYEKLLAGDVVWSDTSLAGVATYGAAGTSIDVKAGFIVLNDLQSTINEIGEGYYIGIADNSAVGAGSPNFVSISELYTLTTATGPFVPVPLTRLDFSLTATDIDSLNGVYSVSEVLEKVGFVAFEQDIYQDNLSFGLFRVRRSVSDHTKLIIASSEKYLASLDSTRKKVSPMGGALTTAFFEELVNNNSPVIKCIVNPFLSQSFDWTTGSTSPTSRVTVSTLGQGLFPLGTYTPDSRNADLSKIIGDVPGKLTKALKQLENIENNEIDVLIDSGLSTVYSTTQYAATSAYNDYTFIPTAMAVIPKWSEVADVLVNFSQNTRKDCFTILDSPRIVFISGKDSKVGDMESKSFTTDIYNPLKVCASYETTYASIYANWIKIEDNYSGRRFWQPISGAMGGVFAGSDKKAYPWYAPAGVTRGKFSAVDIAFNPSQKQKDRLYEISINPVVYFQGEGYVVMGQKTLQSKPTAFDRINVRRLFLSLERAVSRALRPFVFEPNTQFTRTKVRTSILPIMDLAKTTQGLYDYMVVADERNNTMENVDNNEMIVDIYIKPVKAAEFILVNFIATRTGQNFSEII
jgi:hypothetical protein